MMSLFYRLWVDVFSYKILTPLVNIFGSVPLSDLHRK